MQLQLICPTHQLTDYETTIKFFFKKNNPNHQQFADSHAQNIMNPGPPFSSRYENLTFIVMLYLVMQLLIKNN